MKPIILLCVLAIGAGAAPNPLATLRAGHPRLLLLDADLPRLRELVKSDAVARQWHERLRHEAAKLEAAPPTEYKIIGPRLLSASRSVMERVYTLAFLYRLDGDETAGRRAVAELRAAAAWPQWNPSHFLDVAELNHAFGIGYDWLQPLLGNDRTAIRDALLRLGLTPARDAYRVGSWWVKCNHNWNQVCNGGNGIGALAVADEAPELAREILSAAIEHLPLALHSYAPDGGWAEGPGYWNYATRYTVFFLAALQTALGQDFGLSQQPGFDQAGDFRVYFAGPTGLSFNYADAGAKEGGCPPLLWLAQRFQQPAYAWAEQQVPGAHALDLIWYTGAGQDPQAAGWPLDRWFKGVNVVFLRGDWLRPDATWVAFKGGDNRANHSHLDLGTFVLDALGERWVTSLGADNYNLPGYFGKQRWSYYRLNTHGQNTVVIGDGDQLPAAKAPVVAFHSSPERSYGVVDVSAAWPAATRVRRGVALVARRDVLVVDEIEAARPVTVEVGLHTLAQVSANGREATLTLHGRTLHARILAPADASFTARPATQPAPQNVNKGVTKLVVTLPAATAKTQVAVVYSPAADAAPAVGTLDDWVAQAR